MSGMNVAGSYEATSEKDHTLNNISKVAEYLTFSLRTEEYGIDILRVQEIRSYVEPTRLANMPAFVKGVSNLRGVIVPIIDLRTYFGIENPVYDAFTVIIVLNLADRTVGVVVDGVNDVTALTAEHLKTVPEFRSAVASGYINAIGSIDDRMLILIDIEQIISGAMLAQIELVTH